MGWMQTGRACMAAVRALPPLHRQAVPCSQLTLPTHAPILPRRAWDYAKPLLLAPAMNTFMWDSPFTAQHLAVVTQLGATVSCGCCSAAHVAAGGCLVSGQVIKPALASEDQDVVSSEAVCAAARPCANPHPTPPHPTHAPQVIPPVSKRLACGDIGTGGMAAPEDIAAACRAALATAGLLPEAQPATN